MQVKAEPRLTWAGHEFLDAARSESLWSEAQEKISADGSAQPQPGPVGFSAALLPYLKGFSNDAAVAQQLVRLKSQLDEKSNLYGNSPTYYDQNLALFGSGWIEKRFQFGSSGELLVRWSR